MPEALESALIIELAGTLPWSAALPPLDHATGTLTAIDPDQPLDITRYARRDREFQHRDMVAAAAVAKVSIFARTVWNGTVVQPLLQGVTQVTDVTGTNIVMPLDPSQVGNTLPNSSTAIQYVLNSDIPYAAVQVTDINLYNRDLMLYETLARAAAIFTPAPPIAPMDPSSVYVGATSVWATAQGTDRSKVPNMAEPLSQATLKEPDLNLAERDNRVAAYVARIAKALQNPYEYATRIYVQIEATIGADAEESETYVLTNNIFITGNTYTAGEQVLYQGTWYQAQTTTTDVPPSANWTTLSGPTLRQFLAEPSLDSRNRIVYDTVAKTLQWFRETLDLVHVPQIVGFLVPGILPTQTIQTVAAVPEKKDAQFYLQKAARIQFTNGTWASQQVFDPTGNRDSSSTYVVGGMNTLWQEAKHITLTMPDAFTLHVEDVICTAGTYALECLVRPSPEINIAGGDNQQGLFDLSDGGTTYNSVGDSRNWELALPAGGWQLFIEFSNASATSTSAFGIKASQGATSILANTLPIYYTDSEGNPLAQNTIISTPAIDLQSSGQLYNFSVQWTSGAGQLHIVRLRFIQVNGPDTSHYIMKGQWLGAQGTNPVAGTNINSTSLLDVIGNANMADVMPFYFFLSGSTSFPQINVSWMPKSASAWQAIAYNEGDQVLYNLVYWQANSATTSLDVPGQSQVWTRLGVEPQIPLLFEQIELLKFVDAVPTPEITGFQSFRQDMLERALRSTQDAYTLALNRAASSLPEFRDANDAWTFASTGSWMSFIEVYDLRLRRIEDVQSGEIGAGKQYEVITQDGEYVQYNAQIYRNGQKFYGVYGVTDFASIGSPIVNQIGAYRLATPADIGKTGLVADGLQYIRTAGTGTVQGWYEAAATYPTHQVIQPWMIEQGFYTTGDAFTSPDGNPALVPYPDNPPFPHPPAHEFTFIPFDTLNLTSAVWLVNVNNKLYATDGSIFYSSKDGYTWSTLGSVLGGDTITSFVFANFLFVAVGISGVIYTSTDALTWIKRTSPVLDSLYSIAHLGGQFIAVGSDGAVVTSVNGITWTSHAAPTVQNLYSAAYRNGRYVVVGGGGVAFTSTDAATWTTQITATFNDLYQVISDNTQFVAVGGAATVLVSPDGVTWTSRTGNAGDLRSIMFTGGRYYTVSNQLTFYQSLDTITWTPLSVEVGVTGPFIQLISHKGTLAVVLSKTTPSNIVLRDIDDSASVSLSCISGTVVGNTFTQAGTDMANIFASLSAAIIPGAYFPQTGTDMANVHGSLISAALSGSFTRSIGTEHTNVATTLPFAQIFTPFLRVAGTEHANVTLTLTSGYRP